MSFSPTKFRARKDTTDTVATNSTPLKTSDRFSEDISIASSAALIPRKSKRPTVSAKKNLYLLRLS